MAAHNGVVVISLNYRLGPLGFSAFPDSMRGGTVANFGMEDQRLALRWVQREITGFGGDASKVTIFGESAGGISVFHHMVSPLSKGLFRAAIIESGFPAASDGAYQMNVTRALAKKLKCGGLDDVRTCLRNRQATEIVLNADEDANPFTASLSWSPSIDGKGMPAHPLTLFGLGAARDISMLAGTNTDEGNLFVWPFFPHGMSKSAFQEFVTKLLYLDSQRNPTASLNSTELEQVLDLYPGSRLPGSYRRQSAALLTDLYFLCPTHEVAESQLGKAANTFLYRFNHRSAYCLAPQQLVPGVCHGFELPYVFGTPESEACTWSAEEQLLSQRIQALWTNFAKYLRPSEDDVFPKYTNSSRRVLVLQTGSDALDRDYRSNYCQFWSRVFFDKFYHYDEPSPRQEFEAETKPQYAFL